MLDEKIPGLFVAPFSVDGELEGIDYWEFGKLSSKWLSICDEFLRGNGTSFNAPWSGNLSHIQTKFTASSGAALVTFSVNGRPAASVALASGLSLMAESEVMKMFVSSLRTVAMVSTAAKSAEPFQEVLSIKKRPVMIVVPWPDSTISQQYHALVRELAIHLAAAFFMRD